MKDLDNKNPITRISFNDYDSVVSSSSNKIESINAPKTEERLEAISADRAFKRKLEEEISDDDDDDDDRIKIHTEPIDLSGFDILDMDGNVSNSKLGEDEVFLDIEEL